MGKPHGRGEAAWAPLDEAASAVASLFDSLENVQFWIKDCAGRYRTVNRGLLLNFAFQSEKEVLGKTDFQIEPYHIATQIRLDDERVLAGQPVRNRVELVGRFDGTAIWSVTNKSALRNSQGLIVGTTGVTRPLEDDGGGAADLGDAAIARVIEHFRLHLDEAFDNQKLARLAGLSLSTFERRFRRLFQMSPQHYARRLRVRLACHALVYTGTPLAEIASAHGFYDQSHLGRECRRETGLSPREYREQFRGKFSAGLT